MRVLLKSSVFFLFSLYVEIYKICFDKYIYHSLMKRCNISSAKIVAYSEKYYSLIKKFKAKEEILLNDFSEYKKIINAEV